jgi:hypothetical protein
MCLFVNISLELVLGDVRVILMLNDYQETKEWLTIEQQDVYSY